MHAGQIIWWPVTTCPQTGVVRAISSSNSFCKSLMMSSFSFIASLYSSSAAFFALSAASLPFTNASIFCFWLLFHLLWLLLNLYRRLFLHSRPSKDPQQFFFILVRCLFCLQQFFVVFLPPYISLPMIPLYHSGRMMNFHGMNDDFVELSTY